MANDWVLAGTFVHVSAGEVFPAPAGHNAKRVGIVPPFAKDDELNVKGDGAGGGIGPGVGGEPPTPVASIVFVPAVASLTTEIVAL
jgi:hypothetical protein